MCHSNNRLQYTRDSPTNTIRWSCWSHVYGKQSRKTDYDWYRAKWTAEWDL